jgi:Iron-containing redox enzyme
MAWQVAGPAIYRTYLAAARRLQLSNESSGYWELHITEDERHGRQMVEDVALPLVDRCPGFLTTVLLICC